MAKPDIHPQYKPITIKFANGSTLQTFSSIENTSEIEVEITYPINHRAWNKDAEVKAVKKNKFGAIVAASSLVNNTVNAVVPKKVKEKAVADKKKKK